MNEEQIKITFSAMESHSKTFSNCSKTAIEIVQSLAKASASMKPAWDDPAQVIFDKSFEEMVKEFQKVHDCLLAMSVFSAYVAELYRTTDQTSRRLL